MRAVKQIDRQAFVGLQLRPQLFGGGRTKAAAFLGPKSFGNNPKARVAELFAQHVGMLARHLGAAGMYAHAILKKNADIRRQPGVQPLRECVGAYIGAVIQSQPQGTRQAVQQRPQLRCALPAAVDFDRKIVAHHIQRRGQFGQLFGGGNQAREVCTGGFFVHSARQAKDDFFRPRLARNGLPVRQASGFGPEAAFDKTRAINRCPLHQQCAGAHSVPVALDVQRVMVELPHHAFNPLFGHKRAVEAAA